MLRVANVKVYDLIESVVACRNSMRLELPEYTPEEFQASLERAKKLAPMGGGHNNFLSGIRVAFDLVYPNYISPELQRYTFLKIVNSSSKMHKLVKMDMDACFNKYVTDESKEQMKRLIDAYNTLVNARAGENAIYEAFMRVLSNCPLGIELFMRCTTNYLCLRNIYRQRKGHRLKEDWQAFCEFIEKLPYARELILA